MRKIVLSCCLLFVCSVSAFAQKSAPPSGQFGVGIYQSASALPSGVTLDYAMNHNLDLGTYLGLLVQSGGGTATTFGLAPYIRYSFHSTVSPFIQGGIAVIGGGGTSTFGIFMGPGLAYYLDSHFGVHAEFDFLGIAFTDPMGVGFGWGSTRIGLQWFL